MKLYWHLREDGVVWLPAKGDVGHYDDLEMSGLLTSFVIGYGVDDAGRLKLSRHCVWPTLRTIPNDTHASYQVTLGEGVPQLLIGDAPEQEFAQEFCIDGVLSAASTTPSGLELRRQFFPSVDSKNCYERIWMTNTSTVPLRLCWSGATERIVTSYRGTKGVYLVWVILRGVLEGVLQPGENMQTDVIYTATLANEVFTEVNVSEELAKRRNRIKVLADQMALDTGNDVVDMMFRMAKIRGGESIFRTAGGLMHSPGGYNFYAATWCNDQVEYAGPWFAYTGDALALEASMNAYEMYMPFMSPDYQSIPSSIIAEGTSFWERDRGDEAMYAYGAGLFALTSGSEEYARRLYPAIVWCLEYCRRRRNAQGAVLSQTDELEGRFPSGDANLSTNSLYYGGLRFGAILAQELGHQEAAQVYDEQARQMCAVIEEVFGADMGGFHTYRYYEGNTTLRSWISLPLCMGLQERLEGTLNAMLSQRLWSADGMLTEEAHDTVWDRSTLYGFRGAYLGGRDSQIADAFLGYCTKRLLGERVPYAVEAYPEGGRRQLSAESCLFCRIVTDGILAIFPQGLRAFSFIPRVPEGLKRVHVRNIHAFGRVFDILVDPHTYRIVVDGEVHQSGNCGTEVLVTF